MSDAVTAKGRGLRGRCQVCPWVGTVRRDYSMRKHDTIPGVTCEGSHRQAARLAGESDAEATVRHLMAMRRRTVRR